VTEAMDSRSDRLARNETVFRAVNERVEQVSEGAPDEKIPFVCECGNVDCTHEVRLTQDEYERLRSSPISFAVAPGHELPEIETIVFRNERYLVVDKDEGQRSIARRTDPRSDPAKPS
jgi:hypothetical protein